MKKLITIFSILMASSCSAIGDLQDAADALNEAEKTLDQLDMSGCMEGCSNEASDCLEVANGSCVDVCEIKRDACDSSEKQCWDKQQVNCLGYSGSEYNVCMSSVYEYCDQDCGGLSGDCLQACGADAQTCLVGGSNNEPNFSACMTSCIKELEDDLKGIDL